MHHDVYSESYGLRMLKALDIEFDDLFAKDAVGRLGSYFMRGTDCSHQMLDTFYWFAERSKDYPAVHAEMQQNILSLLEALRNKSRPCHLTGTEEESLDSLINTAGNILKKTGIADNQ